MITRRAAGVLAGLCLVLGAGGATLWLRTSAGAALSPDAEDEARRMVIERMVASTAGKHDSHPDPSVGKVLLPSLREHEDGSDSVVSNRFGMREADWEVPKPAGQLRIVLLGDSYIYGMGVAAEERLGVRLRTMLAEHATAGAPAVEVLHIGIISWNIVAECAFVRRQLSLLQPDLVVQHIVINDLDDTSGVRGFGALGRTTPLHPEQADALVSLSWGRSELHPGAGTLLPRAQDGESRARLADAVAAVVRLDQAVRAAGGRYLLLVNWQRIQVVAAESFGMQLAADEVAYLPRSLYYDPSLRISAADEHWNAAGHAELARLLFGLVRERDLLPALGLAADPEAEDHAREVFAEGLAEAQQHDDFQARLAKLVVGSEIEPPNWTADTAAQVYTGISADGTVGPFAVAVLAHGDATRLHLRGRGLDRPEIDGALLHVLVEGVEVASAPVRSSQPIELSAPLPDVADGRAWLAVRLTCDDFAYDGEDLRHCVSWRLERLALER